MQEKSFVWTVTVKVTAESLRIHGPLTFGPAATIIHAPNAGEVATALGYYPHTQMHHAKTAQISASIGRTGRVYQALCESAKLLAMLEDPANARVARVQSMLADAMAQIEGRQ